MFRSAQRSPSSGLDIALAGPHPEAALPGVLGMSVNPHLPHVHLTGNKHRDRSERDGDGVVDRHAGRDAGWATDLELLRDLSELVAVSVEQTELQRVLLVR